MVEGTNDVVLRRRSRLWLRLLLVVLLMALVLGGVAYWQRERITFWLGEYEVYVSGARFEGSQTIVVRHSGVREVPDGVVYQIVIRGPKGIGLWGREVPDAAAVRAAPREVWLTKPLKRDELAAGELRVEFPFAFTTFINGMLDCYLEVRPRNEDDDNPVPRGGIRIRIGAGDDGPQPRMVSNVVAFP